MCLKACSLNALFWLMMKIQVDNIQIYFGIYPKSEIFLKRTDDIPSYVFNLSQL